jgi:small subunit ribosomal protein S4e
MLDKLGGTFAPRPSTGPHKLRESLPLVIFLRNRLKYALTNTEVTKIVMQRLIKVDGKVRTDINYPTGFMGKCNYGLVCFEDIVHAMRALTSFQSIF